MKVFTNIAREHLGGITTTNNMLVEFLAAKEQAVLGLEFETVRSMHGPYVLHGPDPAFFDHYILNIFDLLFSDIIARAQSLEEIKDFYRPAIRSIKDLMQKTRPDIVLANGTSFFPWLIANAAKELDLPVVLRYHGIVSREWRFGGGAKADLILAMEKDMNSLVSGTIFPSQLCREAVESEVIGGASARGRVIPNPVRLPLLKERQGGQRQIAMVARCSPIKNVEAFFRLHETLLAEGWEHKASLVSEKTGDTKIPASIEILAPMPYEALCDFYQQQGLLVASSYFETFGNVPMEALCLGTPVLVNRNMGSAEILSACGFEEMICDFSDTAKVAVQAKALCGQSLDPEKVAKAREILDPGRINKEISDYLSSAIK